MGEGLPCGVCLTTPQGKGGGEFHHLSPSPQSPPARGGDFLRFTLFNVYFGALEPIYLDIQQRIVYKF